MAFNVQRALDDGYTQRQIDNYLSSQNLQPTKEVTEGVTEEVTEEVITPELTQAQPNDYQTWLDNNPNLEGTNDWDTVKAAADAKALENKAAPEAPIIGGRLSVESNKYNPQSQFIPGEDFGRSIEQFGRQIPQLFGAAKMLYGKMTDDDEMIMGGYEQAKKYEDRQQPHKKETDEFTSAWETRGFGGAVDYLQYMAGQGVGMLAEAVILGAIGAAIATPMSGGLATLPAGVTSFFGRKLVKKSLLDQIDKIAKEKGLDAAEAFAKKEVAKVLTSKEGRKIAASEIGKKAGQTGMAAKFGAGEITGRAVDEAIAEETDPAKQLEIIKSLNTSKLATLSVAHALADYAGIRIGLGAFSGLSKPTQSMLFNIFKKVGMVGSQEALVEGVQTGLERYGADLPLADREAMREYLNAAAGGFAMTLGPSVVGGASYNPPKVPDANVEPEDNNNNKPDETKNEFDKSFKELAKEAKKQKATNSAQADADESADNPVALTDTKLASFGINKNTKAYKALKKLDMTNPDNQVVFEQIVEEHDAIQVKNKTGKTLNEKELDNYRSVYGNETAGESNAVPNVPSPAGAEGSAATDGSGAAGSQSNTGRPARRTKKQPAALEPKVEQAELDRLDAEVVAAQERKAERDALDVRRKEINKDDPEPLAEGQLPTTLPKPGTSGERTVLEATDDFIKADTFATNKNVDGATISQIANRLRGQKVKGKKRKEVSITTATRIFNELAASGRYTVSTSSRGVKKLINKEAKAKPTNAEKLSALGNVTEAETSDAAAIAAADANVDVDVDSEISEVDDYSNMSEADFAEGALDVDDNVDDFTTDEYQESRTGVLNTSTTQETTVSVIKELVSEFGDAVNKAIDMGKLVIVDNVSELPSNISVSNTANGAYDGNTGTAFIIANRVKKGESRRVLLHEIGEHHGLKGLLGKDYTRTLNRLKSLKNTDKVVAEVWAQVTVQYKNLTVGDVPFLQEVMAKLGETAPTNKFFNRVRGLVKNFLRKLGLVNVDTLTTADLQDLVMYSLNVSMTKQDGSRTGEFMDSSINPQFKEKRDKETTFRKENIGILKKQLADVRERLYVARQAEQKQLNEDGKPSKYYSDPVVKLTIEEAELVERIVESNKLAPEQDNIQFSETNGETANLEATGHNRRARRTAKQDLIAQSKKPNIPKLDRFETQYFSFDVGFNNAIMRTMKAMNITLEQVTETILAMDIAQAVHAGDLTAKFMRLGKLVYGKQKDGTGYFNRWTAVEVKDGATFEAVIKDLKALAKKASTKAVVGSKKSLTELRVRATEAFTAQREAALEPAQIKLNKQVTDLIAAGKESEARTLYNNNHVILRMTKAERDAALKYITPGNNGIFIPGLMEVFEKWTDVRNNVIETLVAGGKLSKEQADAYWAQLEYMPLYTREQVESQNDPNGFFSGLLTTKNKKLKGSQGNVNDAFENMRKWVEHSINSAIVNKAALEKIDANDKYNAGLVKRAKQGERGNTFTVFRDGKPIKYIASDPYYMKAFTGFENVFGAYYGTAAEIARRTANATRAGVVLWPAFALAQITQDSYGAFFTSGVKNPVGLAIEILKEVPLTILGISGTNKEMSKTGVVGGLGTHMLGGELMGEDISKSVGPIIGTVLKPFNALATATDNAIRTAVYKQSIKEGVSPERALQRAFELINFRRAGASTAVTVGRQTIPFFGAFMQAFSVVGRTMLTNMPGYYGINRSISPEQAGVAMKTYWRNYAMASATSVIYAILMSDEDDYKDKSAAVRDRKYIIGNTGYNITLRNDPFVFISKIVPEYLVRRFYLENVDNRDFLRAMKENFLKSFEMFPAPHAVKIIAEYLTNLNFRTGRDIIPDSIADRDTRRQFTDSTSEAAKFLGQEAFGSPVLWDKFMNDIFGYSGSFALFFTNELFADKLNRDLPKGERFFTDMFTSEWWNNMPGVSNFRFEKTERAEPPNDYQTWLDNNPNLEGTDEWDTVKAAADAKALENEAVPRDEKGYINADTTELKRLFYDMQKELKSTTSAFNDLNTNEFERDKVGEYLNKLTPKHSNRVRLQLARDIAQLETDVNAYRKRITDVRNAPKGVWTGEKKAAEIKRVNVLLRHTLAEVKYYRSVVYGSGEKAFGSDQTNYDLPTLDEIKDFVAPDK